MIGARPSQEQMSITTHVLDISIGRPAPDVEVHLEHFDGRGSWRSVGRGRTDPDGRLRTLVPAASDPFAGSCRLTFETGAYFRDRSIESFHPRVVVEFVVREAGTPHHVPLLISPFGYSTYRGS